jgi:predicted phage tail protein
MESVKSNTQPSLFMSLLNFVGASLLASAGVSLVLIGIVLLLSLAG